MGSNVAKMTPYAVMLSSTYKELAEHREAVRKAMLGQRLMPVAMEDDAVLPDKDLISASLSKVEESDAYVGLISYRYGQAPRDSVRNPDALSLTELEFRRAVERKIPICMFIMHDDHPVTRRAVGQERGSEEKYDAFVKLTKNDRIYAEFKSVDDLKAKAVQSLVELRRVLEPVTAVTKIDRAQPNRYAISNVPITVPLHFLGRDDSLAAIEMALQRHEGRVAITALHGLRGVGKTTLAAAYAERHSDRYRATWWIRAQTEITMRADLVSLGIRLDWVSADEKEEPAVAAVLERLRNEGESILLIFDNAINADALKPYLPRVSKARVLVTSNAHAWRGVATPVEIQLWPKEIGADYFITRTGRATEQAAAEALSVTLGGLPLAHEQAAAYCERLDVSLAEYARRFVATPARLLDDARHAPGEYHDGLTVAKTFTLAIEEAAKLHPAAEPLIVHAALLAPEPIPLFLFAEGSEEFGEPLATALADDGLDEAVAALRTFALVDRETIADDRDGAITTDAIRLHRLVREVAAARRQGEQKDRARRALLAALAAIYPGDGYTNPASWPRCAALTPHLLSSCEARMVDAAATAEQVSLLSGAASYFQGRAANVTAEPLFRRALAICETELGPEHPDTATSLNNLSLQLLVQGDFAGARPLLERAVAIDEKVLGPEHPGTATDLNNLAALLRDTGHAAEAEQLFLRAIAIGEKVLGLDHPSVATRLSNLAVLLRNTGRVSEAEPLFRRAVAIGEKALGPEHPLTQRYQSHYARLLLNTARAAECFALAQAALAVHAATNGPNHLWTKDSARVTADALAALYRAEEARALREKYGISDQGNAEMR
jgi:tetratricopeptide (TPR) repeat protein